MNNYIKGKFRSTDYTFCVNDKCAKRKTCARAFERYDLEGKIVSMEKFECEEDKQ